MGHEENDNYYFEHGDFLVLQECPDDVGGWWFSCSASPVFSFELSSSITSARKSSLPMKSPWRLTLGSTKAFQSLPLILHLDCLLICLYPLGVRREEFYLSCLCPLDVGQLHRDVTLTLVWMDEWDNSNEMPSWSCFHCEQGRVVLWAQNGESRK